MFSSRCIIFGMIWATMYTNSCQHLVLHWRFDTGLQFFNVAIPMEWILSLFVSNTYFHKLSDVLALHKQELQLFWNPQVFLLCLESWTSQYFIRLKESEHMSWRFLWTADALISSLVHTVFKWELQSHGYSSPQGNSELTFYIQKKNNFSNSYISCRIRHIPRSVLFLSKNF